LPNFTSKELKTANVIQAGKSDPSCFSALEDYLFLLADFVGTKIFLFRLPAEQLPGRRLAGQQETCVLS